jgi:catalase
MLQGRLFAYGDAHRYRLGINHTQLAVNAPHAAEVHNYGRDGLMAGHGNGGRAKNYEPNSFDGPVQTDQPYAASLFSDGGSGTYDWEERETDNFTQAGDLYRLQPADAQQRLVDNIAGGLSEISAGPVGEGIIERSIAHFRAADPEFGERVAQGVKERRG